MPNVSFDMQAVVLPSKVTMSETKNYITFSKVNSEKRAWLSRQTLSMSSALKEFGNRIRIVTPEHAKALHQNPARARIKVKTADQLVSVLKTFFR